MFRTACFAWLFLGLSGLTGCGNDAASGGASAGSAGATPSSAGNPAIAGSVGTTSSIAGSGSGGAPGSAGSGGNLALAGSASSGTGAVSSSGATGSAGGSAGSAGAGNAPLFSDGFEGASIDSKWTPRLNGNGTFSLDATQKHGGSKSLHLKHQGFSSMLAFEGSAIFPAPNNT